MNFVGGSSETLTVHAPPGLGDFGGQARGETLGDAFVGDVSVGSQSSKRQKRQPGGIGTPAFASKSISLCDFCIESVQY